MRYIKVYEKFYHPNPIIKQRLDEIVKDLRKRFHGGRSFFDALDSEIKSAFNEDMIIQLVKGNPNEWIVTSGEFGRKLYKMWKDNKFRCKGILVFNGKIATFNVGVINYFPSDFDINNKEFIYVDDSYFSGQTSQKINEYLNQHGSKIKSISVIYDGSKVKKKNVHSFFRYYDDINEKFLPKIRSLFKRKDPIQIHKRTIIDIQKIVDSECPDTIDYLTINEVKIEDHLGKTLNETIPIDGKPNDVLTKGNEEVGTVIINLRQDESNFLLISIQYKNYLFDMITWKQIYMINDRFRKFSPMCENTEKIFDAIRDYLSSKDLLGNFYMTTP